VASFIFFVHPRGPRLADPRWVKASYRWSGYDFGLGGEEFGSGREWNPPAKLGYMWVWAWTQSNLCSTSLSAASGAEKPLLVLVSLWSFVFAQRTALQPRDPYYMSKKEDRRCWNRLAPDAWEKLRRYPSGAKNSPEKCLVDLGRDTRTSTQSRRLVWRKDARWSLIWPSGANLLAHKQHKCILFVPLWLLCTCFSLIFREY